jgi:hypothetical protein
MAWSHWLAYLTATQYECVSSLLIVGLADLLFATRGDRKRPQKEPIPSFEALTFVARVHVRDFPQTSDNQSRSLVEHAAL